MIRTPNSAPHADLAALSPERIARLRCILIFIALCLGVPRAAGEKMDAASVGEARSLIAEAMLLDQLESQHRVSEIYARELRSDLKRQLQEVSESNPELRAMIHEALEAILSHNVKGLAALRDRLICLGKRTWAN